MSNAVYALPNRELVLDRYRPLRPIGRGGSGSVWLARDERSGLEVALKIVPREGKRAARAMREMEAASRLRHPRCVRAYDFGGDEGHVYIAYEYVAGNTMRELLRSGKLTDRDAIETASQVLEGLAHAHAQGIVHRDVKPSNIIVEDAPSLSVRLLDFGLAQFDEADTLTAVGDVPGTLAYIAPERLTGSEASTRSDVWAVGVLLWEALAGQHPFWGVPLPQVAATIAAGAPSLSTERADLSRRLVALVDAALSVDPARRPSAKRLAHELRDARDAPRRSRDRSVPRNRPAAPKPARRALDLPVPAVPAGRLVPAAATAVAVAVGGSLLPFWPPLLLAALSIVAGLAALRLPRLGLAIVLAAPVFPLGNVAAGAAVAYAALALAWFVVAWSDAPRSLFALAGPALGAIGLLALLPLVVASTRHPVRRVVHTVGGVLAATLVAGLTGRGLPFVGTPVGPLRVKGERSGLAVATSAWDAITATPGLLTGTVVLALVATVLPFARRKGPIEIVLLAGVELLALLVLTPHAPLVGTILAPLALGLALVLPGTIARRQRNRPERATA